MIKITFCPKRFYVKIKGHSMSAPSGQDLICSAATIISYMLGESVIENAKLLNRTPTVELGKGDAKICCSPTPEGRHDMEIIYSTALCGFRLLAESYPKYVRLEKKI